MLNTYSMEPLLLSKIRKGARTGMHRHGAYKAARDRAGGRMGEVSPPHACSEEREGHGRRRKHHPRSIETGVWWMMEVSPGLFF